MITDVVPTVATRRKYALWQEQSLFTDFARHKRRARNVTAQFLIDFEFGRDIMTRTFSILGGRNMAVV